MGIGKRIGLEINDWVTVGMLVVVASLILIQYQVSGVICASGYLYNQTANNCYLSTNASVTKSTLGGLGTTINTFVSAFSEPSNWVAIVIIAVIGYAIIRMFQQKGDE